MKPYFPFNEILIGLDKISYLVGLGGFYGHRRIKSWQYVLYWLLLANLVFSWESCSENIYEYLVADMDNRERFLMVADRSAAILGTLVAISKSLNLVLKEKQIAELLNDVSRLYPEEDADEVTRNYMDDIIRPAAKVMNIFKTIAIGIVALYGLTPILEMAHWYSIEGTLKLQLPFFEYRHFDWKKSYFVYVPSFIMQIITGMFAALSDPCTIGILVTILTTVSMESRILSNDIKKLAPSSDFPSDNEIQTMNRGLESAIERHKTIISLMKRFERIFSVPFALHFFFSTFVSCQLILAIAISDTQSRSKFIVFLTSMLLQVLLTCWYVEDYIRETSKLCNAIFESGWYKSDKAFKYKIGMFLIQSQRPIAIKPLGLFGVNLGAFLAIGKTAYSFYTIMHGFLENKI